MRVAMYYKNSDVRLEEMPVPKIGDDEILVKVMASGICGSDVMEWYRIKKAPIVLGHEISAVIEQTGRDVKECKTGDRVFVSHHIPCNTCRYCLQGNHTACITLQTTNFDPGGFAEYIRVPSLNVNRGTFLLPDDISFACVIRGQRTARLQPGQTVLVIGSGISGLMHIMTARALGAGIIIATDINKYRLEAAKKFGAIESVDAREDIPAAVKRVNGNRLADLVIVCTGAASAFDQALKSVDRGGTVQFFAPTEPGVNLSVPVNDFWRNGITLLPSYGGSPYDIMVAIDMLRAGRLPVSDMITHRVGLAETQKGFQLVAGADQCIKVIVEPQK
jgi:L-iditol 2-dehydrogenase